MVRPNPTFWAGEKAKETLPLPSVVTDFCPMKALPSSVPEGLEKNCTLKVLLGALFSLLRTVVFPSAFLAEERMGLFCRLLGPVSASLQSARGARLRPLLPHV